MKQVAEWWWPDGDAAACSIIPHEISRLPKYLDVIARKRTVVQAGGNVGMYPFELSKHFQRVITFEPDPENWACLERNLQEKGSGCLMLAENKGVAEKRLNIRTMRTPIEAENYGATRIEEGGEIPAIPIDDLELDDVDFLFLDIEGYEYGALLGAEKTIARSHPVISLELKGLGDAYGWPDAMCHDFLKQRGYRYLFNIFNDAMFAWQGHPC